MQINFLDTEEKEKKSSLNLKKEEIKFSQPQEKNSFLPKKIEDKTKKEPNKNKKNWFKFFSFLYFGKNKNFKDQERKKDINNLIKEKKKEVKKDLQARNKTDHLNKISDHKKIEKINRKKNSSRQSWWSLIKNIFARKDKLDKDLNRKQKTNHQASESVDAIKKLPDRKVAEINNPSVLESNLIKEQFDTELNWGGHILKLIIVVIICFALLGGVYWQLTVWGEKELIKSKTATTEMKELQNQVNALKKEASEAIVFKNRLKQINLLLAQHIYWTKFFNFLEDKTLAEVHYSGGFAGDINGEYSLRAKTDKFSLIKSQVDQFRISPYVLSTEVNAGDFIVDEETNVGVVSFVLNLKVKPSLFFNSSLE